ncbi:hypothetical protein HMN09_00252900 [Mycena chlorophos]|uniref:Armadillo repeat-containing protein 8 n=1 Tax=Mycena chlorophos TaxID=658473 RepID=A0A8H6WNW2_MYCCL|nr:hypothetical protein HMN09_00252900 [Mycena chlorophos]
MTISLSTLKSVKNAVIGNPNAKLKLSQDPEFVQTLVNCLNDVPDGEDLRVEAAHVISSISYGSEAELSALLRCDAPRAFLYALSKLEPADSPAVRAAFARGLRALAIALADTVGPWQWGLAEERSPVLQTMAQAALDAIFRADSLDVLLPLLEDRSTRVSVAQLLGFALRTAGYRTAVVEWMPPEERARRATEVKTNRGWEKTPATVHNEGGWVCRVLTGMVCSREPQLQEAGLWALATVAKDNAAVVATLNRGTDTGETFLNVVLSFARSRSTNLQLAACACATAIIRAIYPPGSAASASYISIINDPPPAYAPATTVMNVVNGILSASVQEESLISRTRSCFILFNLVSDHPALCTAAYERGCLGKLASLLGNLGPSPDGSSSSLSLAPFADWEEAEPAPVSALREAALTALAALSLFDNTIRRSVTDEYGGIILPIIHSGLSHGSVGVRYAACQCVRALSRAVAVLRTNLVDSGLGKAVFRVFLKEERKVEEKKDGVETEDRRVIAAALAAVCNIVNEFSPLRPAYLSDGLVPRLVKLVNGDDPTLRLSSLWAMKNLLHKSSYETKRDVMASFGWGRLVRLLDEPDAALQEQAWAVLRNIAEDEAGVEMIERERELGGGALLGHVTRVLQGAGDDDVVLQAACLLGNLANVAGMQVLIARHTELLAALRSVLAERGPAVRRPVVGAVLELARGSTSGRRALVDAGVAGTLRRMCSAHATTGTSASTSGSVRGRRESLSSGNVVGSPTVGSLGAIGLGSGFGGRFGSGHMEDDRDVIDQAKTALDWLEHGEAYR